MDGDANPMVQNLLTGLFGDVDDESIDEIARSGRVRIERIVSRGQVSRGRGSPEGFWYDQEETEFVTVLSGRAGLLFEGEDAPRVMGPGDYVTIPAHQRHRVQWTSPDEPTVWLAVFF